MITRSIDHRKLDKLLHQHTDVEIDTSAKVWIANPHNIMLRIGEDYALFEPFKDGVSFGTHLLFKSKGKQAANNYIKMVDYLFKYTLANRIIATIDADNRKMRLFIPLFLKCTKLFDFIGDMDGKPYICYGITSEEFNQLFGKDLVDG